MADPNVPSQPDSPAPTQAQPAAPRKPRRLLRFLVRFAIAGVALTVVLIVAIYFYLQSSHAMRKVYLPLAGKALGTEVTAQDGRVSFGGQLELRGINLLGTDGQPAFAADFVRIDVDPASFSKPTGPVIRDVLLESPTVHLKIDKDGRTNFDYGADKGEKKPEEPKEKSKDGEPLPQFTIGSVKVQNLNFDYQDAAGLAAQLNDLHLAAQNIAPGSEGTFDLKLKGAMQRAAQNLEYHLDLSTGGKLAQSSDRRELGWDGKLDAALTGPNEVIIAATSQGKADVSGKVEQDFGVQARTGGTSVGEFKGDMLWDPAQGQRDLNLTIDSLSREFLNPFLAAAAPMQMRSGELNGHVKVKGIGNDLDFDADFKAGDLSFKLGDQPEATQPFTLHTLKKGHFNLDSSRLELRETQLTLEQGGVRRIESALSSPLKLSLSGGADALDEAAADLTLKLNELSLATLEPWLVMQGVDTASLPRGVLNGDLKVQVARMGQSLAVAGKLSGKGLRAPQLGNTPLDLNNTIDLTLDEMRALKFGKTSLALLGEGKPLATLDFDGTLDIKALSGEVSLALNSADPLGLGSRLGFVPAETAGAYGTPSLAANQTIKLEPGATVITAKGSSLLKGISIPVREGTRAELTARNESDVTLDLKQQTIRLAGLKTEIDQGGSSAGRIALDGEWPMATAGRTGRLGLKVEGFDLSPWLILTRAVAARELPPIPLQADETLELQADGRIKLAGEIKLGLAAIQTAKGDAEAMQVALRHDVQQLGAQIEKLLVDFNAQGGSRPADVASLEASGSLAPGAGLRFKGNVEHLNADPYAAWAERLNPTPETPAAAEAPAPEATPAPGEAKPLPALEGELTVKDFAYQTVTLKDALVKAQTQDGALLINVERGQLCDGAINGQVKIDSSKGTPAYAWAMNVNGAEIAPLMKAADPTSTRELSGKATIQSQGTAAGSGKELLRQLASDTTFSIANGKFTKSTLLNALADYTKIESFRNIEFHDFQGALKIADNNVKIDKFEMLGALHRLVLSGDYNFDGNYDFRVSPAIGSSLADRLGNNKYINKVIGTGIPGFVPLLVDLNIRGAGDKYTVLPGVDVRDKVETVGETIGTVGSSLGSLVGGAIGLKRGEQATTDTATTTGGLTLPALPELPATPSTEALTSGTLEVPASSLAPAEEKKVDKKSTKKEIEGAVKGLLGDVLGGRKEK